MIKPIADSGHLAIHLHGQRNILFTVYTVANTAQIKYRVHPSGSSIYTKTLAVLHPCTTEKMHNYMHVTVLKKTEEMQHLLPCFKLLILGLQYEENLCQTTI